MPRSMPGAARPGPAPLCPALEAVPPRSSLGENGGERIPGPAAEGSHPAGTAAPGTPRGQRGDTTETGGTTPRALPGEGTDPGGDTTGTGDTAGTAAAEPCLIHCHPLPVPRVSSPQGPSAAPSGCSITDLTSKFLSKFTQIHLKIILKVSPKTAEIHLEIHLPLAQPGLGQPRLF